MKVILGKRGSGKTDALIRLAARNYAYIVVMDNKRATAVAWRAGRMELQIPFPLTFDEFVRKEWFGRRINAFMVDDVDDLVRWFAGNVPVLAITATELDKEEEEQFEKLGRNRRAEMRFLASTAALVPPEEIALAAEVFNAMQAEVFKDLGVPKAVLESSFGGIVSATDELEVTGGAK